MSASAHRHPSRTLVELRGVDLDTPGGRPLVRGLSLSLATGDQVALVGRNGVGKSTLLRALVGEREVELGGRLRRASTPTFVAQRLDADETRALAKQLHTRALTRARFHAKLEATLRDAGLPALDQLLSTEPADLSGGEQRKLHLVAASLAEPELLLLDEPTQDLDARGRRWLLRWLGARRGALVVATHDRQLLAQFEHFFVIAESGCRYVPGSFAELQRRFAAEDEARQRGHIEGLNRLAQRERHHLKVLQRRRRKKNVGRLHELDRRTSRARLNEKRGHAQQSQGRAARIRAERITAARDWALAARRALQVRLPLDALVAELPPPSDAPLIHLREVGVRFGQRALFEDRTLDIGRERVAITGANGSGKTTLLRVMLGQLNPHAGAASCQRDKIGLIDQGGHAWASDASLIERLHTDAELDSLEQAAQLLLAHRFPLALARRPLAELSPGERVRAALICLYRQRPAVELLALDEPTLSLDFVGLAALEQALAAWPGGLVVISHDEDFLAAIGVTRRVQL